MSRRITEFYEPHSLLIRRSTDAKMFNIINAHSLIVANIVRGEETSVYTIRYTHSRTDRCSIDCQSRSFRRKRDDGLLYQYLHTIFCIHGY